VLRALDLVLRDGNLPLVILDLQINPSQQLRRIPSSAWFRFQRLLERNATTLVVVSPSEIVSRPRVRLALHNTFSWSALDQAEETLLAALRFESLRTPHTTESAEDSGETARVFEPEEARELSLRDESVAGSGSALR
jgi:hypothetical protein